MRFGIGLLAAMLGLIGLIAVRLQTAAAQPTPNVPPLTAAQLDRLVAPIALYPDPLLAQILMAATYPLEVVEADRWLQMPANAALKGDALTAALAHQPWDPSVKSLIAFPRVLRMLDDNLDWTVQLGDAFLAQQADLMEAVQRLRRMAEAAGSLASGPQEVVSPGPPITIEPATPEPVYVPTYNPWCVYGAWPYTEYPPFYFGAWPSSCVPVLEFGGGIYPPFGFWAWGVFEWRRHRIRIDRARFAQFHARHERAAGIWEHDPAHRDGVPYPNSATAERFLGAAAAARRRFRGFVPTPAAPLQAGPIAPSGGRTRQPSVIRGGERVPATAAPPIFQSFGRGAQVRSEAARGFSSRMSPPSPVRGAPAAAPSFHAAPSAGFGGARR